MIKKLILSFSVFAVLLSCSSDDDGGSGLSGNSFQLIVDGEEVVLDQLIAQRVEDRFVVVATSSTNFGQGFEIHFHKDGNFGVVNYLTGANDANGFPISYAERFAYAGESLGFNLLSIDNAGSLVSGEFNGLLYEDGFNDSSADVTISGGFNLPYIETAPTISGLGVSADINGESWFGLKGITSGGAAGSSIITRSGLNDTAYQIGLTVDANNLQTGDFVFDSNSEVNRLIFLKYDANGVDGTNYDTTGMVSITEVSTEGAFTVIRATYSFVAVHPETNEQITVESGVFVEGFL